MSERGPIVVSRRSGQTFTVDLAIRDHRLVSDEPTEKGGEDLGPTPVELFLASLAACSAITIEMYAGRKGWPLEGVSVELTRERAAVDTDDGTATAREIDQLRQRITLTGDLTPEQRERLRLIAGRCPVHRLLSDRPQMIEELIEERGESALPR